MINKTWYVLYELIPYSARPSTQKGRNSVVGVVKFSDFNELPFGKCIVLTLVCSIKKKYNTKPIMCKHILIKPFTTI
jgi:hypothetical protein